MAVRPVRFNFGAEQGGNGSALAHLTATLGPVKGTQSPLFAGLCG